MQFLTEKGLPPLLALQARSRISKGFSFCEKMNIQGFEHCVKNDQIGIGLEVICGEQNGLIEWNEEYRSDYYTGLHQLSANEPFKVVFENGDIFYPLAAICKQEIFYIESLPFKVGSRVFWTADSETLKVEIAKDENGFFVISDDDRGESLNRWPFLADLRKYVSTVIKK